MSLCPLEVLDGLPRNWIKSTVFKCRIPRPWVRLNRPNPVAKKSCDINVAKGVICVYLMTKRVEGWEFEFHDPFGECLKERMIKLTWTKFSLCLRMSVVFTKGACTPATCSNLMVSFDTFIYSCLFVCLFVWFYGVRASQWAMASSSTRFLYHTQRHTTVDRTALDKWSASLRDLYLTTHNTHNRETSMPPAGFEPTISAAERPQTYTLDRTVTGAGLFIVGFI